MGMLCTFCTQFGHALTMTLTMNMVHDYCKGRADAALLPQYKYHEAGQLGQTYH